MLDVLGLYELVTVFGRDGEGRTLRLLLPMQASHPETTSRLFVGLLGFEPRLKQSKCFVLTVTL